MANKKKSSLLKYVPLVLLVLGVLSFVMMFLNALKIGDDSFLKGTEAAFGSEFSVAGYSIAKIEFNILALLAFALPLVAGVIAVVPMNKKNNGLKYCICTLLFVAGAVLLFIMPSYVNEFKVSSLAIPLESELAIGTILGGIFAALGGVTSVSTFFVK